MTRLDWEGAGHVAGVSMSSILRTTGLAGRFLDAGHGSHPCEPLSNPQKVTICAWLPAQATSTDSSRTEVMPDACTHLEDRSLVANPTMRACLNFLLALLHEKGTMMLNAPSTEATQMAKSTMMASLPIVAVEEV